MYKQNTFVVLCVNQKNSIAYFHNITKLVSLGFMSLDVMYEIFVALNALS
jgi:hypothetical protein